MDNRKIGFVTTFVLLTALFIIPAANNTQKTTASKKVMFEIRQFHKQFGSCVNPDSDCVTVDLWYPEFISTPNMVAKDSINNYVKDVVINGPPDDVVYDAQRSKKLGTFDESALELFSNYSEYQKDGGAGTFLITDSVCIASDTCGILSLVFDHLHYTGGAHESYWRVFLNFDIFSGKRVNLSDILRPNFMSPLRKVAKQRFKEARGENSRLWEVYQDMDFPLNNNYSIGIEGITFYYNPYEIGSFSEGTTELLIKYDEIKDLIDEKGLLKREIR